MSGKWSKKIMNITKTNTKYNELKIGQTVEIISECVDMTFFKRGQTGIITRLSDGYLGVIVKLDGGVDFNFHPENLKIIEKNKKCPHCKQEIKVAK